MNNVECIMDDMISFKIIFEFREFLMKNERMKLRIKE